MYYTYVLLSVDGKRTYTGHTGNLQKRLKAHNRGDVRSSKRYKPYKLLFVETFGSRAEAKVRESYYKNFRGRQKIKQKIELVK